MAKITAEWIKAKASEVMKSLEDGFQWSDLMEIIPDIAELVSAVDELSYDEKKEAGLAIINYIIDETDTPYVPDSLVDPIFKKIAPYIIDYALKAVSKE